MVAIPIDSERRPSDWPEDGAIDLARHDLPHPLAAIEWWYLNAHLRTPAGREFAVFASFFRIVKGLDEARQPLYAHSLTWAISDLEAGAYHHDSRVDRDAPSLGLDKLARGEGSPDPRLRRALREVLERGSVPYPDRMFEGGVMVATTQLDLEFDGARFTKLPDHSYRLTIPQGEHHPGCELRFRPRKAPVRHGDNGVVKGVDGGDMFYYFIPRCDVRGTIALAGENHPVQGDGWYDHEFGGRPAEERSGPDGKTTLATDEAAWNWVACQFDDGSELTAYTMVEPATGGPLGQLALIVEADGTRRAFHDVTIEALNRWRSTRSFNDYPTRWRVSVPSAGIDLRVDAAFEDQEFVTLISKPAFWEGRVQIEGVRGDAALRGRGYVERSGFPTLETLDDFFSAVGEEVRRSVSELLPRQVPYEQARDLIASEEREHYMDGVNLTAFSESMAAPVRDITDRGGKSWRSYAALACCDVVGGDSRHYVQWLAMPEFLHVGSLIVDDVEDRSEVRRGGPACHVVYGDAIAINAGTGCYFLGQKLLKNKDLNDAEKLRVYDLYFEALRAGHAGQALDLHGLHGAMHAAVESGDGVALERQVLAIHRLKTAAPAGALARMGAVAGHGDEKQIEALGQFFEGVGIAFQIMDDVLNLRGFRGKLKTRGEDLMRGMVTMPVVKAITRLGEDARRTLWDAIKQKPQDRDTVEALIAQLEACGAIEACVRQAEELVEKAWRGLDPLIEDSLPKLMLRAFGWYVLERQY